MSLKTVHTVQSPWFYPVGNTSPVCFTQNLPPEEDADLLLLGCGDIRSVLFTAYSEDASSMYTILHSSLANTLTMAYLDTRTLDFTCCDLEAEIIARNILALSIIVDDTEGERILQLWNIYYHVFLDTESAALLHSQAQKLLSTAGSMQAWTNGPYGRLIRFCDSATLEAMAKRWASFALTPATGESYRAMQAKLRKSWAASKRYKEESRSGDGSMIDTIRSAAPLISAGYKDNVDHSRIFWRTGTCIEDKEAVEKLTVANPMFSVQRSPLTLHYATNPLASYYLALTYARLAPGSPMKSAATGSTADERRRKSTQVAITQLSHWCTAFRAVLPRVTIRYTVSDALAFCHVLQYQQQHGESKSAHWYRTTWTYDPLILDGPDYDKKGDAPTAFHVIDTSNLIDHLGCLNLLTGTAALLVRKPWCTIRTEMLNPREGNLPDTIGSALCGDLPTVALLLGLNPVQYWSNATATWQFPRLGPSELSEGLAEDFQAAMSRPIILWKPVDITLVRYEPDVLAKFLLTIYLEMFQDESWSKQFSTLGIKDQKKFQRKMFAYGVYTRASFVVLLRAIKGGNTMDWNRFMTVLIEQGVLMDSTLDMGPHHVQSLLTHLDVLSVWLPNPYWWQPCSFPHYLKGAFRNWENIPATLCVTLVVPHTAVAMFGDVQASGTPLCNLQLHSSTSSKEAILPDMQLGFGRAEASGKAYTNEYALTIHDDPKGWKGKSPLIVSAMVSTRCLVDGGDRKCHVVYALKSTPASTTRFLTILGARLQIHRSAVGKKDVFITRYRPNMSGHVVTAMTATSSREEEVSSPQGSSNPSSAAAKSVVIYPVFNKQASKINALRIRFTIVSEEAKVFLQQGGEVVWKTATPYTLILTIGRNFQQTLLLPLPLSTESSKTRIARKSLWIEYTAPVVDVKSLSSRPDFMFRMSVDKE
ncbi:hypothetical protein IAQ61_010734 [Plenodomus lingam]|nr:hypothetical protein IAQ61_010734 [Plenodomus lingam]